MTQKTRRPVARNGARAGWTKDATDSNPKIIDFALAQLTRPAKNTFASWKGPRGSYREALLRQQAIKRNAHAGPLRLVVGFLRILLVVENWPPLGWRMLDYFPLVSEHDRDLLLVTRELQRSGYPCKNAIKGNLSAAVFSPGGVKDDEAKAAMARLGHHGFEISDQVVGIHDPKFLALADGED
jgi:hypothetical protein